MTVANNPNNWKRGKRRPPPERIVKLALLTLSPSIEGALSVAQVLDDAMQEDGWDHPAILPLAYGIALDLPTQRGGYSGAFRRRYGRAVRDVDGMRGTYEWALAVLAACLFGDWPLAVPLRDGSRSPWPVVRAAVRRPQFYCARVDFTINRRALRDFEIVAITEES